jgi:hypothetical protein
MSFTDGSQTIENLKTRLVVDVVDGQARETVFVKTGDDWTPALQSVGFATRIPFGAGESRWAPIPLALVSVASDGNTIRIKAQCPLAELERELRIDDALGAVHVHVKMTATRDFILYGLEDYFEFVPEKRAEDGPLSGPLDAVWSQNIKKRSDNVCPHWTFKSPTVLMQQGPVFAALVPSLRGVTDDALRRHPLALDLDVTEGPRPSMRFGVAAAAPLLPNNPEDSGHSGFIRSREAIDNTKGHAIEYRYTILASAQPERLGYREAVRYLWSSLGHYELLDTLNLQQNWDRRELWLFDDWRADTWKRYTDEIYLEFELEGLPCALLTSRRQGYVSKTNTDLDAWFHFWMQSLRTAYGWHMHGQRTGQPELLRKAERVFNTALTAPGKDGAFAVLYYHERDGSHTWLYDDGWAGYRNEYHTVHMSWTAYWLLRWAQDLQPERKDQALARCRAYGDFLLRHQLPSGCIPSWYNQDAQPEREAFREFNAEVAQSAFFLAELGKVTGERRYIEAAERVMTFIEREVLPRQRWFDFETFISCARKPYDFYDTLTTQYPQNNVSTLSASMAYLKLYEVTGNPRYLELGEQVTDYLCLTQQVWNHPSMMPKLVGGFTTQNTDAEWSDARQGYAANLFLDYYNATGRLEYLERAVAAARSGFAVAPYENWAHAGYGYWRYFSGIHWGTGTVMASVEMMDDQLGDAYVDVQRSQGVGFNACSVQGVNVSGDCLEIGVSAAAVWKEPLRFRFSGLETDRHYQVRVNGAPVAEASGAQLLADGLRVPSDLCISVA